MAVAKVESRLERRFRVPALARVPIAIVLVGAGVMFLVGLLADRPITFPDEAIYGGAARSLAAGDGYSVAGTHFSMLSYGPIYPLLLAPVFRVAPSIHDAYFAARAFNALVLASGAIPVWWIARRLVEQRAAVLVTAASVALPASVYATKLQTESLAYPLVLWSVVATLRVVESPTWQRQLGLLALLVPAPLVRFQLLALIPALLGSCLLCAEGPLKARLRRLLPLVIAAASAGIAVAAVVLAPMLRGGEQTHGLNLGSVSPGGVVQQFVSIVAAVDLYTGILPFALMLMFLIEMRSTSSDSRWLDGEARVLAIVTCASTFCLATAGALYLAGIPAIWRPPAPPDRYAFYVAPLMLILFARWFQHGAPRAKSTLPAALLAAVLPLVAAATQIHGRGLVATSNALSFMPWMLLRALTRGPWWLVVLGVYCGAAVALLLRAPRKPRTLIRFVAIPVALVTFCAFAYVSLGSWYARGHTPAGGWLDANADGPVIGLWLTKPTDSQAFALWEAQTMNRNLAHVYYVRAPDKLGPATKLSASSDGRLFDHGRPVRAEYVLTASNTPVAGGLIDRNSGLALYRVAGPVRVTR